MRKLLSTLSSTLQGGVRGGLLFLALVATTSLWAHDFQVGDLYYKITSETTVEVTYNQYVSFDNYSSLTTATIPESITHNGTTYSVTSIGDFAFWYCSSLTSVTIPNSVTYIGEQAFRGCSSLTSVTIGNSVTNIGHSAFHSCSSLTSVTIPESVTSIGDYAFSYCSSLTSVTIGNSVTSIGDYAFYDCSSLTSVTIPESVTSIGNSAFSGCSSLTSVTIPNSVTSIGDRAFLACNSLTSITIPNSVTSIGNSAFSGCSSLTSVTIGNSVTSIGDYAFYDCSSLTSVTIPESVTSIGNSAFSGCSSLTSVTIPNSVTSIGDYAFHSCSSLTSITCEATTPPILGTDVFYRVSTSIPVYVPCGSEIAYKATSGWKEFTNIQEPLAEYSITVGVNDSIMGTAKVDENTICGAHITATANYGYHFVQWSDGNTDNPRSLVLTQDTTLTAEFAQTLSGTCGDNLTWQFQPEERKLIIEGEGNMYDYQFGGYGWWGNEDKGEVPWSHLSSDIKTILLPEGMTSIGDGAFSWCIALKTISIPNSVKTIGYAAFTSCDSLTFINFGTNITHIGPVAFAGCSAITILNIPNSVTSIGADAFLYCSSLTSVAIPKSVTSIGGGAFNGCSSLTSVTIPNSVTSIGNSAFGGCSSLTSVTIGNSVTSIGDWAFYNCEKLGTLVLGDKVKEIGEEAFNGCNKLYHIYCYAPEPPMAYESSFANYNVNLYVPCNYLNNYKYDKVFGSFRYIQCIESEDVTTDEVVVIPGTNDVTIIWPTEGNADTYTIVIKKDGEVVCTLTFNAEGQLLNIAFAPGRDGNHPVQYAEAVANGKGFRFTVTGLEEGTDYTYDITVKDASNKTIKSHSGKFTTESLTAVENTHIQSPISNCQKILRDGQLLILRDGVEYNAVGVKL